MSFSWNTPGPSNNSNNNGGSSGFGGGWGSNQNQNSNNNASNGWRSSSNSNPSSFGGNQPEGASAGSGWGNNGNSNTNTSSFGGFGGSTSNNNTNPNSSNIGGGGGWGNSGNAAISGNNSNSPSALNPNGDHIVNDPPSDSISAMQFHPNQARFVAASWDSSVSMYEFFGNNQSKKLGQQTHDRPVLACCFNETGDAVISAGCDQMVKCWTPQQNQFMQIGQHRAPVRCVAASKLNGQSIAISASWDQTMAIWDSRASGGSNCKAVFEQNLGAKVYAMAQSQHIVVVATSDTDIKAFDLRQSGKRLHSIKEEEANNKNIKAVNLKKQIRCIDIFPDGNGYVAASIGGRVIIKHLNRSNAAKDFSYKCHRHNSGSDRGAQHVFAVNVLRFHQQSGAFATGGDDGEIVTWDMKNRSKLHNFKPLQIANYRKPSGNTNGEVDGSRMPIAALDYHSNGQYMLYASSYNWNKGLEFNDQAQQKPQIYLHQTKPEEFLLKKKHG